MQFAIHLNCSDMMSAIDATSTSNQSAFNARLKDFARIKLKLNKKMSTIKEFYKTKEKNASEVTS